MLYLPALNFENHEVRLPVSANEVIHLCALYSEHSGFDQLKSELFVASPGLLLFTMNRHWRETGGRAVCLEGLFRWMKESLFNSAIESDAFEIVHEMHENQARRLSKWRSKPTRKRLIKFLSVATGLDPVTASRFVEQVIDDSFDFNLLFDTWTQFDDKDIFTTESKSTSFPVRQMWILSAKLQRLRRKFESDLHIKKMESMKQLAYGASHEINNPLANIATRAQALMSDERFPSRRQRLSVIYAQAMRAHEMISDMMLFAHPPELSVERGEAAEIIERIVGELRGELKSADVRIRIRQYPDVPNCEFDVTQIAVAIKAMLQNAICAIGSAGEIRIQIWRSTESKIAISIADDGPGIDAEIAGQIFDPFYSGREAGRGLGFGLSKAWRIIELHGGELCLDDDFEAGARFIMTLPIDQIVVEKSISRIDNVRAA